MINLRAVDVEEIALTRPGGIMAAHVVVAGIIHPGRIVDIVGIINKDEKYFEIPIEIGSQIKLRRYHHETEIHNHGEDQSVIVRWFDGELVERTDVLSTPVGVD